MVDKAKRFDTQSFKTLFEMGEGGGRINPSLYISVSNSREIKAGSITWQNGRRCQKNLIHQFSEPYLEWGGGQNQPFSLYLCIKFSKRKPGSITWQNGCRGHTIWYAKFQNPICTGGEGGRFKPSLYISVSNSLKRKPGSRMDVLVVEATQFDTQSFKTLFGMGGGQNQPFSLYLCI